MYCKFFRSMLDSTIWVQEDHVVRVWITVLLLCDSEGVLHMALPGIARRAHVNIDQAREAIAILEAPDPDSQSKEEEGRRMLRLSTEPVWFVVNYKKYRNIKTADMTKEQNRLRMREYRRRKKEQEETESQNCSIVSHSVADGSAVSHQGEGEGEEEGEGYKDIVPPAAKKPRKKKTSGEMSGVAALMRYYEEQYVESQGVKPVISFGRDTKLMKQLMNGREEGDMKKLIDEWLKNPPDFWAGKGLGIPHLVTAAPELVQRLWGKVPVPSKKSTRDTSFGDEEYWLGDDG